MADKLYSPEDFKRIGQALGVDHGDSWSDEITRVLQYLNTVDWFRMSSEDRMFVADLLGKIQGDIIVMNAEAMD